MNNEIYKTKEAILVNTDNGILKYSGKDEDVEKILKQENIIERLERKQARNMDKLNLQKLRLENNPKEIAFSISFMVFLISTILLSGNHLLTWNSGFTGLPVITNLYASLVFGGISAKITYSLSKKWHESKVRDDKTYLQAIEKIMIEEKEKLIEMQNDLNAKKEVIETKELVDEEYEEKGIRLNHHIAILYDYLSEKKYFLMLKEQYRLRDKLLGNYSEEDIAYIDKVMDEDLERELKK